MNWSLRARACVCLSKSKCLLMKRNTFSLCFCSPKNTHTHTHIHVSDLRWVQWKLNTGVNESWKFEKNSYQHVTSDFHRHDTATKAEQKRTNKASGNTSLTCLNWQIKSLNPWKKNKKTNNSRLSLLCHQNTNVFNLPAPALNTANWNQLLAFQKDHAKKNFFNTIFFLYEKMACTSRKQCHARMCVCVCACLCTIKNNVM